MFHRWSRQPWRAAVLALGALPLSAVAQTVPPAPPQGSLPTPQQVTPPPPQGAPPAEISIDSRGAIVQRPCPFDASPLRITLTAVEFTRPDGSPLQHLDGTRDLAGLADIAREGGWRTRPRSPSWRARRR